VGDDVLDGDPTVRRLEMRVAELLGKERAFFFPSGTMANQAAVWLLARRGTEVLLDAASHLIEWEHAGLAAMAGVQIRPVPGGRRRARDGRRLAGGDDPPALASARAQGEPGLPARTRTTAPAAW
jgi:threonine aldolase